MFKAYKISEDVYWVGALEWDERYIHGFSMPHGSTNNAYLIMDEKVTLIDTCQADYSHELMERIADVVDPAKIDVIVSNHGEKDHAGSIKTVLEAAPNAQIVTSSPKGEAILKTYLGESCNFHPVKSGDTLNIGKRTLTFVHTPMVHWPDNMVTYSDYDRILFSNDAFGQFFATSHRFDDEENLCEVEAAAKKYFANIVAPFAKQTIRAISKLEELDLGMIAPSHGVIWRSHLDRIIQLYKTWCAGEPTNSAVVVFSSMYGTTKRMAETITEAFMHKGVEVRMFDLDISDISDIMTYVMDAKYLAVGSSTHNGTVLPYMGQFLTYLKGLAPKGRTGIAFGSYGWMQAGVTEIADLLAQIGYELPLDTFVDDWNDNATQEKALFEAIGRLCE